MRKIGIFTDVHGNYQALQAITEYMQSQQCDSFVFCGDAVDMGPSSAQCLELLFSLNNAVLLAGNHDRDCVFNLARHAPLSHTSAEHKRYVFDSIPKQYKDKLHSLPLKYTLRHGDTLFTFCHYAFNAQEVSIEQYPFAQLVNNPNAQLFDQTFAYTEGDVIFFGHKHEPCDIQGKRLYVDVGSVGCHREAYAKGIILQLDDDGSWSYQRVQCPYDRDKLKKLMLGGSLPDAQYIFDFYFEHKYGVNGDNK